MSGTPIPGEHWLLYEFPESSRVAYVDVVKVKWEKADCKEWVIEYLGGEGRWETLYESREGKHVRTTLKDTVLVDEVQLEGRVDTKGTKGIRLRIIRPATRWGTSVWNWELWGGFK